MVNFKKFLYTLILYKRSSYINYIGHATYVSVWLYCVAFININLYTSQSPFPCGIISMVYTSNSIRLLHESSLDPSHVHVYNVLVICNSMNFPFHLPIQWL